MEAKLWWKKPLTPLQKLSYWVESSKAQAKEDLETLYKSIHNKTLVSIDKVYRRAKEALGI